MKGVQKNKHQIMRSMRKRYQSYIITVKCKDQFDIGLCSPSLKDNFMQVNKLLQLWSYY